MDCAKSIDELYDEVKDYDLVVTNDAALATALNGRVEKPIIGRFATTPLWIAEEIGPRFLHQSLSRDLKVIADVSDNTGLDLRYVHSEIENIKEIRKYTKEVDNYLYTKNAHNI